MSKAARRARKKENRAKAQAERKRAAVPRCGACGREALVCHVYPCPMTLEGRQQLWESEEYLRSRVVCDACGQEQAFAHTHVMLAIAACATPGCQSLTATFLSDWGEMPRYTELATEVSKQCVS